MSKFTNKKHGLVVGYDNIFFIANDIRSPLGIPSTRDGYRSIVWDEPYNFNSINSLNVWVRTPADQLLCDRVWDVDSHNFVRTISPWYKKYLMENVGELYKDWDVKTMSDGFNPPIFFKRKKDALLLVNHVISMLDGMRYSFKD